MKIESNKSWKFSGKIKVEDPWERVLKQDGLIVYRATSDLPASCARLRTKHLEKMAGLIDSYIIPGVSIVLPDCDGDPIYFSKRIKPTSYRLFGMNGKDKLSEMSAIGLLVMVQKRMQERRLRGVSYLGDQDWFNTKNPMNGTTLSPSNPYTIKKRDIFREITKDMVKGTNTRNFWGQTGGFAWTFQGYRDTYVGKRIFMTDLGQMFWYKDATWEHLLLLLQTMLKHK